MTIFTRLLGTSAAALMIAGPVLAAGPVQAPVEPVVQAPAPVVSYGGDWTGGYAGLNLGYANVDTDAGVDGDGATYGLHLGYDYDFGQFVLGAELEYDAMDIDVGGATNLDSVARLKLRGGYDMGRTLLYVTAGVAEANTSTLGSDTGGFAGLGLAYQINEQFYVGGEILEHRFDNFNGSGIDVDATTVSIRGGVRF